MKSLIDLMGFFSSVGERLLNVLCAVCGDRSSGKHYGIYSCDGKSSFVFFSIDDDQWLIQVVRDFLNEVFIDIDIIYVRLKVN